MAGFAVLDFETTGFAANDRVVEVGLVLLSPEGAVEDEWSTLLNPGRDVGPTGVHGITARDVVGAPDFASIVPRLLKDLRGRVVVSHNIGFDLRFLGAELRRAGVALNNEWLTGLCTMKWAGRLLPAASRKLQDCCDAAGVVLSDAHCALADARAVASLLKCLMERGGVPPPWMGEISGADEFQWPEVAGGTFSSRSAELPRRGDQRDGLIASSRVCLDTKMCASSRIWRFWNRRSSIATFRAMKKKHS